MKNKTSTYPTAFLNALQVKIGFKIFLSGIFSFTVMSGFDAFAEDPSRVETAMQQAYGFTENKGQIKDQNGNARQDVLYMFDNGHGFKLIAKTNAFSYELYEFETEDNASPLKTDAIEASNFDLFMEPHPAAQNVNLLTHRIDITLQGANPNPEVIPGASFGYTKNFVNNGIAINGVQDFDQLTYKDIYPYIDLVFYKGSGGTHAARENLKYDFILHPGADINNIKLHYKGASTIEINMEKGESTLTLGTRFGTFSERIPEAYVLTSQGKGENLNVEYTINDGALGFSMNKTVVNETIVLDPIPERIWGTYFGGSRPIPSGGLTRFNAAAGTLNHIMEGSDGHLYVIGYTSFTNGIATSGAHQQTSVGSSAVLGSYNKTNGRIRWMTYFNNQSDAFSGIGHIPTGFIEAPNNNLLFIRTLYRSSTGHRSFLVQFDRSGHFLTDNMLDIGEVNVSDFLFDHQGNLIVTGNQHSYSQNSAHVSPGAHQEIANDTAKNGSLGTLYINGYLAKIEYPSLDFIWGTLYGGVNKDRVRDVAMDAFNNIYIAGHTESIDNISSPGAFQEALSFYHYNRQDPNASLPDAFIAKFNADGKRIWGSYYGDNGSNFISQIFVDQANHLLVFGNSIFYNNQESTSNWATPGAYQATPPLAVHPFSPTPVFAGAFFGKLNSNNGHKIWATYTKDGLYPGRDRSTVTIDPTGGIIIASSTSRETGVATSDAFKSTISAEPPVNTYRYINGQLQPTKYVGKHEIALERFDANGNKTWGTYYGGNNPLTTVLELNKTTSPRNLFMDSDNHLYLLGSTTATNGIATPGTQQEQISDVDSYNGFIAKFNTLTSNTLLASISVTHPSCSIANDGSVTATFTGGTGAISYRWEDGSTSMMRNNLSGGFYAVTITDASGQVAVAGFKLEDPVPISRVNTTDVACRGDQSGTIDVFAPTAVSFSNDGGNTFQNNSSFSGLAAGNYELVVRDGNACLSPTVNVTINEPAANFQASTFTVDATCGVPDGTFGINANGGTLPYEFSFNNGSFGPNNSIQTLQGIQLGSARDANGCVRSVSDEVQASSCSTPFQNPNDRFDVNNDGHLSPSDVIVIINYLNSGQPALLPTTKEPNDPFLDVNGDGLVTAIDALMLINRLNTQ